MFTEIMEWAKRKKLIIVIFILCVFAITFFAGKKVYDSQQEIPTPIDYSKQQVVTLDGSNLILPRNYQWQLSSDENGGLVITLIERSGIYIAPMFGGGIHDVTIKNWNFTGEPVK